MHLSVEIYDRGEGMNAQRLEKPNKPMVPTATTSLNEYTPSSPRQHIGQPLGSLRKHRISSTVEKEALRWAPVR